ncbi:MAG: crotonase/enoyl-CoA hydratase family protein [Candidatus Rokuibacteriota bacterium]
MSKHVRVEKDGPITTVVLDRPEARNAVNPEIAEALFAAFVAFDADPDALAAVFWGAGGAFCAGFDLKFAATAAMAGVRASIALPAEGTKMPRGPMGPTRLMLSKPVIAAVAGPAVAGGMELALWCDCRVMEEDAYFGVYCRRWGVPLLDGGTIRLPRLVGQGRALNIIMTGRQVTAEEAHRIGLCERIAPKGHARRVAEEMAREIARFPQECVRCDRRSVHEAWDLGMCDALTREWVNAEGARALAAAGAGRFAAGAGRHGDFSKI